MTNYDRIKAMSVEEMVEFLAENVCCGCYFSSCSESLSCDDYDKKLLSNWLESECGT